MKSEIKSKMKHEMKSEMKEVQKCIKSNLQRAKSWGRGPKLKLSKLLRVV